MKIALKENLINLASAFNKAAAKNIRHAQYKMALTICGIEEFQCQTRSNLGVAFLTTLASGYATNLAVAAMGIQDPNLGLVVGTSIGTGAGFVNNKLQTGIKLHQWACATRTAYDTPPPLPRPA